MIVDDVLKLLEIREMKTTHFVTLVYSKNVNETQCEMGYSKFIRMLNRRIYGRHSRKIRVKQLGFLETNFNGYYGVHVLFDFNDCDVDLHKQQIKNLWSNYLKVEGRNIGSNVCFKQTYFTGTDITGWFEEIYDLDGVVGYVTKYDGKKDVLTGNDKMILLGV